MKIYYCVNFKSIVTDTFVQYVCLFTQCKFINRCLYNNFLFEVRLYREFSLHANKTKEISFIKLGNK